MGTWVLQAGLDRGADVTSVSRKGRPKKVGPGTWGDAVQWTLGDALDPAQPWRKALEGATGVISTLGAFGTTEQMYKVPRVSGVGAEPQALVTVLPSAESSTSSERGAGFHGADVLVLPHFGIHNVQHGRPVLPALL